MKIEETPALICFFCLLFFMVIGHIFYNSLENIAPLIISIFLIIGFGANLLFARKIAKEKPAVYYSLFIAGIIIGLMGIPLLFLNQMFLIGVVFFGFGVIYLITSLGHKASWKITKLKPAHNWKEMDKTTKIWRVVVIVLWYLLGLAALIILFLTKYA